MYTLCYVCNALLSFLSIREARSAHQLRSDGYMPSQATKMSPQLSNLSFICFSLLSASVFQTLCKSFSITAVLGACFVCSTCCLCVRILWFYRLKLSCMEMLTDIKEYEDFLHHSCSPLNSSNTSIKPTFNVFLSDTCFLEPLMNLHTHTNCISNPAQQLHAAQQGSLCMNSKCGAPHSLFPAEDPLQKMSMSRDDNQVVWIPSFTHLGVLILSPGCIKSLWYSSDWLQSQGLSTSVVLKVHSSVTSLHLHNKFC